MFASIFFEEIKMKNSFEIKSQSLLMNTGLLGLVNLSDLCFFGFNLYELNMTSLYQVFICEIYVLPQIHQF